MSFFSLGGGSEATRPTFFELVAAQQLVPTLKEATVYSLSVLAQGRPWWYRLLQYDDEIFALLTALLNASSLSNTGGTFSESLYSLRRATAESACSTAASGGGGSGTGSTAQAAAPLSRSQRRNALILSVLLPYLQTKLSSLYMRNRTAPAALPGLENDSSPPQHAPLAQQQQQQQQPGRLVNAALQAAQHADSSSLGGWDVRIARLRERLRSVALDAFLKAYPLVHAGQESSKFLFQLLYLLERTPFYSPALWLLGQRIVRISGTELAAVERRVARRREAALQQARQTGNLIVRLLRLGYLRASFIFTDHTRNALILSVFAFEALRWWYTTAEGKLAELGKRPPPPPPPPPAPHPVGVGLPADRGACPICRRQRTNPALLEVSGYAFCYPCLHGYLERNGCCPVTRFPANEDHIRRVYPDA